ncbi:MAG: class I SAM-dependent methyltransferase, partial [Betaproteobacteria bacterium]|nr:class I SAM-dependent methyltransferase [Betaproteobacteria bacterium]
RGHYLGRLQQGMPRLEVLAQLAAAPESRKFLDPPGWPLWVRPVLWALRLPTTVVRRGARAALRRVERRVGKRIRGGPRGLVWRLAVAIDDRDRFRQGEWDALSQEVGAVRQQVAASERRLTLAENHGAGTRSLTDELAKAMAAIRARLAASEYVASDQPAAAPTAPASDTDVTRYYLTLESVFRGEPAQIRAQLEADYLDLVARAREEAGDGPCVDLGCGRGEWLDVLRDRGFAARGVDLNPAMAAVAIAAGHEVASGDALAFLRGLADDSVLAISAFHLAEHLDFPTLFRLVAECRRVLKPRGLLILETPNPENIWVATHTFHHDPTHGNPLTPASLEFLVNHHGLETVAVLRLHPYPDAARLPGNDPVSERLNAMTCGGQDFAIVAKKTPPG